MNRKVVGLAGLLLMAVAYVLRAIDRAKPVGFDELRDMGVRMNVVNLGDAITQDIVSRNPNVVLAPAEQAPDDGASASLPASSTAPLVVPTRGTAMRVNPARKIPSHHKN